MWPAERQKQVLQADPHRAALTEPQHCHCGKRYYGRTQRHLDRALTEPQHCCCGKPSRGSAVRRSQLAGFNRAAALLLRKVVHVGLFSTTVACFNRAAALLLRKADEVVVAAFGYGALTEPQHCCCGKAAFRSVYCRGPLRSFNRAAALLLRKGKW